jgi:hypothetical protein
MMMVFQILKEFKAGSFDPGFWTLPLAIKIDQWCPACLRALMNASMTRCRVIREKWHCISIPTSAERDCKTPGEMPGVHGG